MHSDERICSMALTFCQGIGHIGAKRLVEEVGSAAKVFENRKNLTDLIPEATQNLVNALDNPDAFQRAEKEIEFIEKNNITCLTFNDERYPARLRECEDAPVVLFYKGTADLNNLHVVSMVGTRRATEYGKQFCADFLRDLSAVIPDALIVSGLAYGIDVQSHRSALSNQLETVGVLAHGLDRIYPQLHRKTAVEMVAHGGLLTEYLTGTEPEAFNFVARNRIVAGVADAVIVVESARKGGSLITADLASGYHRDCFAVPGRIKDEASVGCNQLIRDNKAALIENAEDFLNLMNWMPKEKPQTVQRDFFPELNQQEQSIVKILTKGDAHVNILVAETGIPIYQISGFLFELEMKGVVKALVGGVYHLIG